MIAASTAVLPTTEQAVSTLLMAITNIRVEKVTVYGAAALFTDLDAFGLQPVIISSNLVAFTGSSPAP